MKKCRIGYIGWIGDGNLGDEACYQTLSRQLNKPEENIILEPLVDSNIKYDHVIVGGGTLLSTFGRPVDKTIAKLRRYKIPYSILGTSIEQLDLPNICNWKDIDDSPESRRLFKDNVEAAKFIGLRDELSVKIISSMNIDVSQVKIIGDLSFLTSKQDIIYSPSLILNRRSFGINIGTSFNNIYGRNEEYVFNSIAKFIDYITDFGYNVVLFPVWSKDLPYQHLVYNSCKNKKNILEIKMIEDYRSLAKFLSKLDFVLGIKLHSVIFSLIAGTPAISIAYREKCIGMMECLDLKNAVVRTDCPNLDELLFEKFLELNSIYDVMIERFSNKIIELKKEIFKLIDKILKSLF